jgi:membrane protein
MLGGPWRLLREAAVAWSDDYAPSMGAALAYYTLFSIAPLLLIVISVAGLVFGQAAARGEILEQLAQLVGSDSACTIESLLQSLNKPGSGVIGTLVGLGVLVIGATSVFAELQDAMDRIWRAPPRPAGGGLWSLVRTRLLSLGLVLGIGFLLMVSLIASAALAALGKWWEPWFRDFEVIANVLNLALGIALVTAIFAMIYKCMPRVKVAWRDVWIGASLTAVLFTVGKTLIGLYIGRSGVASAFGAAASLVVLLVWVYYSAQIFLLGAEFTWVYAHRRGSLRGQPLPPARSAAPVPAAPSMAAQVSPPVPQRPPGRSPAPSGRPGRRAGRG